MLKSHLQVIRCVTRAEAKSDWPSHEMFEFFGCNKNRIFHLALQEWFVYLPIKLKFRQIDHHFLLYEPIMRANNSVIFP